MRMRIALVGNGQIEGCTERLTQYDAIIALDGGAVHCARLNIVPTVIIGDGDSITSDQLAQFTSTEQHITDNQTTTDLQKGIAYVLQTYGNEVAIELFGVVSENRIDHTIAAMHALQYVPQIYCIHTSNASTYFVSNSLSLQQVLGTHVSISPINQTARVTLTGFEWSGENITLTADTYSGITNSIVEAKAMIIVDEGEVFVHVFTDSHN